MPMNPSISATRSSVLGFMSSQQSPVKRRNLMMIWTTMNWVYPIQFTVLVLCNIWNMNFIYPETVGNNTSAQLTFLIFFRELGFNHQPVRVSGFPPMRWSGQLKFRTYRGSSIMASRCGMAAQRLSKNTLRDVNAGRLQTLDWAFSRWKNPRLMGNL